MKILPVIATAIAAFSGAAMGAPISGGAEFSGGVFGNWKINYLSGSAGLLLQQAKITLGPGDFFDTTGGDPGFAAWQDLSVNGSNAAATGYSGANPGTAAARNGALALTLFFTDFQAGESFSFNIDVDQTAVCTGGILARAACRLGASLTSGEELAGAMIEFTFGGGNYAQTAFAPAIFTEAGEIKAAASFRGEIDAAVPEPGSLMLMGAGLLGLGIAQRRWRS